MERPAARVGSAERQRRTLSAGAGGKQFPFPTIIPNPENAAREDRCHSERGARVILPSRGSGSADRRIWFGNGAPCRAWFLARKVVTDRAERPSTRFFGRRTGSGGTGM